MRSVFTSPLKRIIYFFIISCSFSIGINAQNNCVPIVPNTAPAQNLSLGCGANCTSLNLSVPHLKQTSDYAIQNLPYNPYPYTSATGTELTALYADDQFSAAFTLPFTFCFYDSSYSSFVVGSNGLLTFDLANQAACSNAFNLNINEPIPSVQAVGPCQSRHLWTAYT